MSTHIPSKGIDPDDLLREMNALIEYADASCSESEDFMRGMQFMFDVLVEKLQPHATVAATQTASAPQPAIIEAKPPRFTP